MSAVLHRGPDPSSTMAQELQDDIIFARLAPGTRLTEDALLARFGTSRHYVRQCLDQLERLGLAVRERNKGFTVRSLTPTQAVQISAVRELVQRQAALLIKLPASAALIADLRSINNDFAACSADRDLRGVHDANDKFHLRFYGESGNAYLLDTIRYYMQLSLPFRAQSLADPEALRVSWDQHCLMIQMLQRKDSWSLAQLCVDHIQPSLGAYLAN